MLCSKDAWLLAIRDVIFSKVALELSSTSSGLALPVASVPSPCKYFCASHVERRSSWSGRTLAVGSGSLDNFDSIDHLIWPDARRASESQGIMGTGNKNKSCELRTANCVTNRKNVLLPSSSLAEICYDFPPKSLKFVYRPALNQLPSWMPY